MARHVSHVGAGAGTALYQLIRYGVSEVDWQRAIFVAMFTCLVALLLPPTRLLKYGGLPE